MQLGQEAERRLSPDVYQALFDAGLFSMFALRKYGGLELPILEAMSVWEAVARIDSATAWNLFMNQVFTGLAAFLPDEGAAEVFANGPTTLAGAYFPQAAATKVESSPSSTTSSPSDRSPSGARTSPARTSGGTPSRAWPKSAKTQSCSRPAPSSRPTAEAGRSRHLSPSTESSPARPSAPRRPASTPKRSCSSSDWTGRTSPTSKQPASSHEMEHPALLRPVDPAGQCAGRD